jgi:histone acetyltransferase (RNA polymerase elongator complex component)
MDDQVLSMSQRGHTSLDTEKAVNLLKKEKYEIGLQMMVGLPGDDESKSLASGRKIADLSPDFVRIYPTVVLGNSLLAKWYKSGNYTPLTLDACISLVKKLYLLFKKRNIQVVRMGLQISKDLEKDATIIAGPYHPAFGHLVYSEIFFDMAVAIIKSEKALPEILFVKVNPKSISKMRGLKNKNIITLKKDFNIKSLKIISDPSLAEDSLTITDSPPSFKQE